MPISDEHATGNRDCSRCGASSTANARFCKQCGARVATLPGAKSSSAPRLGGAGGVTAARSKSGPPVVVVALAAAAIGIGVAALALRGSSLGDRAGGGPDTTERVTVRPVDERFNIVAGYTVTESTTGECQSGSNILGSAYRCFADSHYIYDPCWSSADDPSTTVLCLTEPWSTELTRLSAWSYLEPIGRYDDNDIERSPWGVELTTGERCLLATGARGDFNGRIATYSCDDDLLLLDEADESQPLWTFQSGRYRDGIYVAGPTVSVRTAWYGLPNPPR